MDFQFVRNDFNEPEAILSDDHLALGLFLTTELAAPSDILNKIQNAVKMIDNGKIQAIDIIGKVYQVAFDKGDVCVSALVLKHDVYDELPESTELYDQEQISECGFVDFKTVFEAWLAFCCE
jgi:uncharacterized protein YacL (UPF0231 family)